MLIMYCKNFALDLKVDLITSLINLVGGGGGDTIQANFLNYALVLREGEMIFCRGKMIFCQK